MSKTASPFDDDAPPPARRERRPWWRWNIITLAITLFVLVWLRHFVNFGPATTWTLVLTIFAAWAILPMLFVPTLLTTMTYDSDRPSGEASPGQIEREHYFYRHRRGRNLLLAFFNIMGIVLLVLSTIHLFAMLAFAAIVALFNGWSSFGGNMGWGWIQLLTEVSQPLLEMIGAASLIVLCEIALRLDLRRSDK